jgi:phage nucleotide-binding protein
MAKKKRSSSIDYQSFEEQIISIDEVEEPFIKMVVYGKPKVGKTTFAGSVPDVLLVDCEMGTMSVRGKGIKAARIKSYDDINLLYWFLRKGKHNFKGVAIDTLTSLQGMCLDFVMKEAAEQDLNKDVNMPERRDWGKLSVVMQDMILQFRNLPMHVVFTAHERSRTDDEGDTEVSEQLTPGVQSVLNGAVDIIGRLYVKETEDKKGKRIRERRMLVGSHDKFVSGDRSGKLGHIFKEPTFPKVLARVYGKEE